jgi:hypothetical protein
VPVAGIEFLLDRFYDPFSGQIMPSFPNPWFLSFFLIGDFSSPQGVRNDNNPSGLFQKDGPSPIEGEGLG